MPGVGCLLLSLIARLSLDSLKQRLLYRWSKNQFIETRARLRSSFQKPLWSPMHLLSPEDKDHLLNLGNHAQGPLLPNSFFEPIIETKVFINQESPH